MNDLINRRSAIDWEGVKMDAVEFLKNFNRMCAANASLSCSKCKASDCCIFGYGKAIDPELLVQIVEVWAKEHPAKTRQSEFLEHYPNALISGNKFLSICPFIVDNSFACCNDAEYCYTCKEKYWLQEVE